MAELVLPGCEHEIEHGVVKAFRKGTWPWIGVQGTCGKCGQHVRVSFPVSASAAAEQS